MLPFLGFVSGTTSRYLYAPTIGFAWMIAGLLVTLGDSIERRSGGTRLAAVTVGTVSAFIVLRFSVFTLEAIRDRPDWFDVDRSGSAAAFERMHPGSARSPAGQGAVVRNIPT